MKPLKLTVEVNGKLYTIQFYHQVGGYDWMAYSDDVMGSGGPGKTWHEAADNCIHSLKQILSGELPAPIAQELQRYKKYITTDPSSRQNDENSKRVDRKE